jgi:hypothetical protein
MTTNAKATPVSTAMTFGDREADVDRGDHHQPERVDDRVVQPPERQWRRRLDGTDDHAPDH